MSRGNRSAIDERLISALSGREKIRQLIIAEYGTLQKFAGEHTLYPVQVSQTLSDDPRFRRENPEIRQCIADAIGIPREEIDAMLDEPVSSPSAAMRQKAAV